MKKYTCFLVLFVTVFTIVGCGDEGSSFDYEVATGTHEGYQWVNLGLSVKWATCNVGALQSGDYGGYFAWAEVASKSDYGRFNYQHWVDQNENGYWDTSESVIDSQICGTQYDAARVNWGGNWRMPTYAELKELVDKCTWDWINQDGKMGYEVTGLNGNSIFLPASGYYIGESLRYVGQIGSYWSDAPHGHTSAYFLVFGSGDQHMDKYDRYDGRSVRPVCD